MATSNKRFPTAIMVITDTISEQIWTSTEIKDTQCIIEIQIKETIAMHNHQGIEMTWSIRYHLININTKLIIEEETTPITAS